MATIQAKPNENHLSAEIPRWFAVRTRFRDEKVALKMLTNYGVHTYLPIQNLTRRYGKKIRQVELPLINSFVFVKICSHEYKTVLQTEYVTGFLKLGQNILAIPEEQIELMRRLLGEGVELVVEPTMAYEKGDLVEVTSGALLGLRGTLVTVQGKDKMLVDLINSGYTLQISIDKALLSKVLEEK
ncbi:MAG: UpxY family transcription antiterminator [Saprospiraceae bacterium]|nr:UpxY family transcription antiterminator [Saprospiraceae bacterium]